MRRDTRLHISTVLRRVKGVAALVLAVVIMIMALASLVPVGDAVDPSHPSEAIPARPRDRSNPLFVPHREPLGTRV
jgi:hypothetical protein